MFGRLRFLWIDKLLFLNLHLILFVWRYVVFIYKFTIKATSLKLSYFPCYRIIRGVGSFVGLFAFVFNNAEGVILVI
ncbi:unnamed protein product [Meloidogyne enterolobii]|uniref:Uncharacterized protein n=1 Tax=Meloidogyne enterolobii TaxID=390850 RepID=A0ACB0YCK2_MELEN